MNKAMAPAAVTPFYGTYRPGMKLADLHIHTRHSDGWWEPEALALASLERGLSAIAITDHDGCAAGFEIADLCARRGLALEVIPGSEISAREAGRDVHVIGLGLERDVPPWMSVAQTVEAILSQGGIPLLPHPKEPGRGQPTFDQILALETPVAVEVFNAGVEDLERLSLRGGSPDLNEMARRFYEAHQDRLLGAVGGTDAHFRTVGRGLTAYDGNLLDAIRERRTAVLYRRERERLRPWDLAGYVAGLRRLDRRRSAIYGPRPR